MKSINGYSFKEVDSCKFCNYNLIPLLGGVGVGASQLKFYTFSYSCPATYS